MIYILSLKNTLKMYVFLLFKPHIYIGNFLLNVITLLKIIMIFKTIFIIILVIIFFFYNIIIFNKDIKTSNKLIFLNEKNTKCKTINEKNNFMNIEFDEDDENNNEEKQDNIANILESLKQKI